MNRLSGQIRRLPRKSVKRRCFKAKPVQGKKITLIPKVAVDREFIEKRLAESFEDFRHGRVYGPFSSAKEAIYSLRARARKVAAKKR